MGTVASSVGYRYVMVTDRVVTLLPHCQLPTCMYYIGPFLQDIINVSKLFVNVTLRSVLVTMRNIFVPI